VSHTDGFHTKLSVVQTSPLPILVSNNESGITLHVRAIVAINFIVQNCKRQFSFILWTVVLFSTLVWLVH